MLKTAQFVLWTAILGFWNTNSASAQDEHPTPRTQEQDSRPERLLVESYITGLVLMPQDRAFLLARLSSASAEIQPSLCRLWSEELFRLSFKLPMNWDRIAFEKNALIALSAVDPSRAFELFAQIDPPVPLRSSQFPEDLRTSGANMVFFQYWHLKGPASLEELRSQAERLGSTGQYPYIAMAPILVDVAKSSTEVSLQAGVLFADALAYYGRGSNFQSEDGDFIAFLEEIWEVIPHNLKEQGVELAVAHLVTKLHPPTGEIFYGQVHSANGVAQFQSAAEQDLYNLLPRIREVNPKWAQKLVEDNPILAQAQGNSSNQSFSGAAVIRSSESETNNAQMAALLRSEASQLAQLNAAMNAVSANPEEALRIAATLEPERRFQVYARIATALASTQADRASKLMNQTQSGLDSVTDETSKFQIVVSLATAAAALGDRKVFGDLLTRGFRTGEELLEEDLQASPGKLSYQTASFAGLGKLTQVGIQVDPSAIVPRIERVQNDALKADLLAVAAQALHDRPAPSASLK